jgi:predicted esterase
MTPWTPDFLPLRAEVFRRYTLQDWQGALRLLESERMRFTTPPEAARIIYWRACFLCLLRRPNDALKAFQAGLAQGYWWDELLLRHDSDLRSLQNNPAYESLIEECKRRNAQADAQPAKDPVRLVVEPPATARRPYPLLLALHGYSNNAIETLPHWAAMAEQGWFVAALQSSQVAGMDGFHWLDETRAISDVRAHLQALVQLYLVDQARLVIGGFSNGGRTALMLALRGIIRAKLAISVGSGLRAETLTMIDWDHLRRHNPPRLKLIAGEHDKAVRPEMAGQAEHFKRAGLDVSLDIVPGLEHEMPADFSSRLAQMLASL